MPLDIPSGPKGPPPPPPTVPHQHVFNRPGPVIEWENYSPSYYAGGETTGFPQYQNAVRVLMACKCGAWDSVYVR